MSAKFFKSVRENLNRQDRYGNREVGVTHPDNNSFIRLRDDGSVEIFAGEEVSIVLNPISRTVTINADCVKFHTRTEGGLRWNKIAFNERAVGFSEPTFIAVEDTLDIKSVYRGVDYYTDGLLPSARFTFADPTSGEQVTLDEYAARFQTEKAKDEINEKTNPNSLEEV